MKKAYILPAMLAIGLGLASGCQKEAPAGQLNTVPGGQSATLTVLRFTIGQTQYQLDAIRETETDQFVCGTLLQNSNNISYDCSTWNTYDTGVSAFTIARQDDGAKPLVRLALLGNISLESAQLPQAVSGAILVLNDFERTIIPPGDDAALGTGPLTLASQAGSAEVIITARKGQRLEGTFHGVVFTTNNKPVEITNGQFTSYLDWK